LTEPAWSSTGVIAFFQNDDCPDCAGGGSLICTIREDGSNYVRIGGGQALHDLDWSPTASHWAYTTLNPRDGRIAVSLAEGSGAHTLTAVSSKMPRWSPDGAQLAFIGSDGIYVMNADGSGQQRVYASTALHGIDW
jgi:Tol biopolymer transport system component